MLHISNYNIIILKTEIIIMHETFMRYAEKKKKNFHNSKDKKYTLKRVPDHVTSLYASIYQYKQCLNHRFNNDA